MLYLVKPTASLSISTSYLDIWFWAAFTTILASMFGLFFLLKKKKSNYRYLVAVLILTEVLFGLLSYLPFVEYRDAGLIKALLLSIGLWTAATICLPGVLPIFVLVSHWKKLSITTRLFGILTATLALSLFATFASLSLSPS